MIGMAVRDEGEFRHSMRVEGKLEVLDLNAVFELDQGQR
jgi:hypothetical protein